MESSGTNKQRNKQIGQTQKQKREKMHTARCGNTCRQKFHAEGSRTETKIQEFMYRDKTKVEHKMYYYTRNKWSHQNSNTRIKGKNVYAIPGEHSIGALKKTAILGTSHIIRKVLRCEN